MHSYTTVIVSVSLNNVECFMDMIFLILNILLRKARGARMLSNEAFCAGWSQEVKRTTIWSALHATTGLGDFLSS